jgi:hypothetical protein
MAEKIINDGGEGIKSLAKNLMQRVGLIAIPVSLEELVENSNKYRNKLVETTGFYQGNDKKYFSKTESSGLSGAWGISFTATYYYVREKGRLYSSGDPSGLYLPIETIKPFGIRGQEALDDEAKKVSTEIEFLHLSGTIHQRHTGEYFLSRRYSVPEEKP